MTRITSIPMANAGSHGKPSKASPNPSKAESPANIKSVFGTPKKIK